MVRQHYDDCLCLLGCCTLSLLDYSGGRRSILPCLRAIDMLRREKFMVCRKGQLMEREAREEPAAFTECLRRIGNGHVGSLRSDRKSGLSGICSHWDCRAERATLEEKTHIAKMPWVEKKNFSSHSIIIFFYLPILNFSAYSSRALFL